MSVRVTKLERIHAGYADCCLALLKGEPLLDANGRAVLDDDSRPIYVRPTAATLREIRTFLKDNGIDSEPLDGTPTDAVTKKLKQFDGDPLYLEESGEVETLPEAE